MRKENANSATNKSKHDRVNTLVRTSYTTSKSALYIDISHTF